MKRILGFLFAIGLLVLATGAAHAGMLPPAFDSGLLAQKRAEALATGQPYALLMINDHIVDLSSQFTAVPGSDRSQMSVDLTSFGVHHVVNVLVDPDPFITFGATTTNLTPGVTTFAFLFGTPVVPGLYTNATSTGGVSLTNGASGTTTVDNSAIYPTYISGYGTLGLTPTNLGVDLGTGSLVASGTPFQVTVTRSLGTTSNSFAPTMYDNLEALLTYTQDDVSSIASWSGAVTLDIPEPASFALVAAGAIVFAMKRTRPRCA